MRRKRETGVQIDLSKSSLCRPLALTVTALALLVGPTAAVALQSTGGGGTGASLQVDCDSTDETLTGTYEFDDAYCTANDYDESDVVQKANEDYEAELTSQRICKTCSGTSTCCADDPYYLSGSGNRCAK